MIYKAPKSQKESGRMIVRIFAYLFIVFRFIHASLWQISSRCVQSSTPTESADEKI